MYLNGKQFLQNQNNYYSNLIKYALNTPFYSSTISNNTQLEFSAPSSNMLSNFNFSSPNLIFYFIIKFKIITPPSNPTSRIFLCSIGNGDVDGLNIFISMDNNYSYIWVSLYNITSEGQPPYDFSTKVRINLYDNNIHQLIVFYNEIYRGENSPLIYTVSILIDNYIYPTTNSYKYTGTISPIFHKKVFYNITTMHRILLRSKNFTVQFYYISLFDSMNIDALTDFINSYNNESYIPDISNNIYSSLIPRLLYCKYESNKDIISK